MSSLNFFVMREEFIHYLWKYKLFDSLSLSGAPDVRIVVVSPGEYNRDAGPDFFNSKIKIGDILWAGNVEIHVKSSYYEQHGHQHDPLFDNIILHVVVEDDKVVYNSRGEKLPTAVLSYDPNIYKRYLRLVNDPHRIACHFHVGKLDNIYVSQWLGSLSIERLENKVDYIDCMLSDTKNDWNEVFYRLLSRYFGFKVNSEPFELLSRALPSKLLMKHADNRLQIESMLFGTAGMLDEKLFKEAINDEYYKLLLREYMVLSTKYCLKPINGWLWKFGRLRPQNFPTVRIAQMATIMSDKNGIFSRILETKEPQKIYDMLAATASEYWNDHYVFGKKSKYSPKAVGESAINILVINVVVPILFVYGKKHSDEMICEKAIDLLEYAPAEENMVVREWEEAGLTPFNGFEPHALLQLMTAYCSKHRCVECRIGVKVMAEGLDFISHDNLMMEP